MTPAEQVLQSVARKMREDFEEVTSIITHRASKGRAREEIVARFLERYLPPTVRVAQSAEIITTAGAASGEIDIVICDPAAPQLYDERTFRVLPIESAFGVVEVKSSLAASNVADAVEGIRKVKSMPRTAHRPQRGAIVKSSMLYGRKWREHFPTLGHIFAFRSGGLPEIAQALVTAERDVPFEQRVDAIYLLDKGLVVRANRETGVIDPTPSESTDVLAISSDNPLRGMLLQLHNLYESAWQPGLDLKRYYGPTLGESVH